MAEKKLLLGDEAITYHSIILIVHNACFYNRVKLLSLNDVNDDKLILFYCYICREIKEI